MHIQTRKPLTPWALILLLLPLLRPLAYRLLTVSRADELRLLLGVSLALGGGVLAENVGISPDIGALLTGVMLAGHPKIDDLSGKLWSLKEVFLVTFFLQIGLTEFPTQEQALTALELLITNDAAVTRRTILCAICAGRPACPHCVRFIPGVNDL